MKRNAILAICALSLAVFGCGGKTPEPKTGASLARGSETGAPPVKPKRQVSGEAKAEFEAAVKNYQEVRKSGLSKSACADAAAVFAKVYEDHPKLPEAKFNEGLVLEECGEVGKAEQIYQETLRKHPNFGPALNNLGQMYFSRGQVDQALTYFRRAADQKNSDGYANLAVIQRNQAIRGQPDMVKESIDNIHRALAVDSFNIEAYGTMALVLYDHAKNRSQLEMARLICVQAIKVNDRYAPVYNVLGLILLRMGRVTPALKEFRKAAEIDSSFKEAHMNIGAVTLSFRDYASAERAFSRVLELNPPKQMKRDALVGLGVAYRGKKNFSEAMKKYQEAMKLSPGDMDITYNMGILIQDYTFDASNPAAGIAALQDAANYLQQYAARGRDAQKVKDAEKRIKNINELLPMLQEQQRMMQQAGAGAKS